MGISFHVLTVALLPGPFKASAKRELDKLINKQGLRHVSGGHNAAAKAISKHPLVARVTVTYITECNSGVYRNGRNTNV